MKIIKIIIVALFLVSGMILFKYRPLYKVEINNKEIGYVKDKDEMNSLIEEYTR